LSASRLSFGDHHFLHRRMVECQHGKTLRCRGGDVALRPQRSGDQQKIGTSRAQLARKAS